MFASNVPVIGVADPERVVEEKMKLKVEDGKSAEDKWAALLAESQEGSTGAETGGKATKRNKKA